MAGDAIVYSDGSTFDRPRTHVLIIGVGHYPNLKGGGINCDAASRFGQLKSPPKSARRLAEWFISEYNYPPAPIGSVALLLSEARIQSFQTPDGATVTPPAANYDSIAEAVGRWFDRGNGTEASRLIFIFCGHGFGYGIETSLLTADFDFRRRNRWDDAIDLGQFAGAMDQCAAAEQIYFIDACRSPHGDLVAPNAAIGRSPIHAILDPRDNFETRRNAPLIFATGQAQPARGRTEGISVFAEAFLQAVDGMGARDDTGNWLVSNLAMLEAMDHVSVRLTEEHFPDPQQPQGSEARRMEIHYLRRDPVSPIYVTRDDGAACGPGELHYSLADGEARVHHCAAQDDEVEIHLPYGTYDFELVYEEEVVARKTGARCAPIYKYAKLMK